MERKAARYNATGNKVCINVREEAGIPTHQDMTGQNGTSKVECLLCVCIPLGGHRRSTSPASDVSGEAGSDQVSSVVGPPGERASKISYLET